MPNPTPMPRRILPIISIQMFRAPELVPAPARKKEDATRIVGFRPNLVQTLDATKLANKAAKYSEDVNS